MGDLWDLWFLIIPAGLVLFVVFVILNSIFNIKVPTDGRPIHRAPAGSSDSSDSFYSSSSTHPGYDSSTDHSSSHSGGSSGDSSDSGSSGGGDGGGGGGGD
jgi:uncharacterized membrane protein YgcG